QPENINENAHNAYGVASTPNGVSVDCHDFASQNLAMTQEEKNLSGSLKALPVQGFPCRASRAGAA
ncbi:MAG: hypothetical protein J6U05_06780, partial [Neisseriaceae bacterium]|nr:hypothetical protein [Neisseriaceae bacterium]